MNGSINPGLSSTLRVKNWISGRSLYFSSNFSRRGNSSRKNPHQDAQKFKKVVLPFKDARVHVFPFKSVSSKAGKGSLASSQVSVAWVARVLACCPYHSCQPSLLPPSLAHIRRAFSTT